MRIGAGLSGVTRSLLVSPLLLRGAGPGSTGDIPFSDPFHTLLRAYSILHIFVFDLSRTARVPFCIAHGAGLSVSRTAQEGVFFIAHSAESDDRLEQACTGRW